MLLFFLVVVPFFLQWKLFFILSNKWLPLRGKKISCSYADSVQTPVGIWCRIANYTYVKKKHDLDKYHKQRLRSERGLWRRAESLNLSGCRHLAAQSPMGIPIFEVFTRLCCGREVTSMRSKLRSAVIKSSPQFGYVDSMRSQPR